MTRVHVICSQREADRILPRMARHLTVLDGWTMGAKPDPTAEVNYYLGYTELAGAKVPDTKTAAYFTHRETGAKGELWDRLAPAVDLRIVTAEQYRTMLEPFGLTVQAPPPVELDHFTPAAQPRQRAGKTKPVIGVSGWVYAGGRKGEKLVRQVVAAMGKHVEWRGAGKGWPVPTQRYSWADLPDFYRSLDVYFCAATVEGVPMPPLEALACGVPVVIPGGVGMLDDLPERSGVFHYKADDLKDALAALEAAACRVAIDYEGLRRIVAGYTPEAWRAAHADAFATLLADKTAEGEGQPDAYGYVVPDLRIEPPTGPCVLPPLAPRRPEQRTDRGVFVVAYGGPARECAHRLLTTLRQHMPEIPVALAADTPLDLGEHFLAEARGDIGARSVKTRIYDLAPAEWEYVLYLDADTELVAPVPFLFDALTDGWEFVICKNPGDFHTAKRMTRPDNVDECRETFALWGSDQMTQWNGGVFGFRRTPSTEAFFRDWYAEWQRYGKRDQAALLRALWAHPLRMLPLGNEWNLVPAYDPISKSAGIVHHVTEAREWGLGVIPQRGDSPEAFAAVASAARTTASRIERRAGQRALQQRRDAVIVTSQTGLVPTRRGRVLTGGTLVRFEVRPGQFVKVRPEEAERLRRLQEEREERRKMRVGPSHDKERRPGANK